MNKQAIRTLFIAMASLMLMAVSCDKYDDSALVARMDKAESDIAELKTLVERLNSNLTALSTAVDALKKQDQIVAVTELSDKSGYVVEFTQSGKIYIYNGKNGIDGTNGKDGTNGQDGLTPTIGVKLDSDGNYYWTVNGTYLLDDKGNKIAATAHVATPQLRINEGNFEISYNGGATWEVIGSAGNTGGVVFSSVVDGTETVTFNLADGTKIEIPKAGVFKIIVDDTDVVVSAGASVNVSYSVSAADDATVVDAFGTKGFETEIKATSLSAGTIVITAPKPLTTGKVYIIAVRGDGVTAARILSFEEGKLVVDESAFAAKVPASGGVLEIPVSSNIGFEVMVDPGSNWISYVETKAMHSKTIVFSVKENTLENSREGTVFIIGANGMMKEYTIVQSGTAETPVAGGGSADLETMNGGNASQVTGNSYSTKNGWLTIASRVCSSLSGGSPRYDDVGSGVRPVIAARNSLSGTLSSPTLNGGCGTVTIDYTRYTSKTGSNLTIAIKDTEGNIIKSESHTDETLKQWERNELKFDFNVSGDFQIVITGNKCENTSKNVNDDLMVISVSWTGYSE